MLPAPTPPFAGQRIAVVVDGFPRWSERFIARELIEFQKRGIDFTVFAMQPCALPLQEREHDREFEALQPFVRYLPSPFSVQCLWQSCCSVPLLVQQAARARFITCLGKFGPRALTLGARSHVLAKWLRDGKYTVVYAHFASWPSTIGWLAAGQAGLPLVCSFHARDVFVDAQLVEQKLSFARNIFVCHKQAFDKLKSYPGAQTKLKLARHGLPLSEFAFAPDRERHASEETPFRLIATGRFVDKKGWPELITALRHPNLSHVPWNCDIFTDSHGTSFFPLSLKAFPELQKRVKLHLPLAGTAWNEKLRDADLFVAPYRVAADGDRDGIPNAILEAMALGLPVLGTQAGSMGEILTEDTGWVVPERDPAGLAQGIKRALGSYALRMQKAVAARHRIEADFDQAKNMDEIINALLIQK